MIYFFTPYVKGNIGKAYNEYMKLLPKDDDWAVLTDGDIMFLDLNWGEHMTNIINSQKAKEYAWITCKTNRVLNNQQILGNLPDENSDIIYHKTIAEKRYSKYGNNISDAKYDISGMLICLRKSTWRKYPFREDIMAVDTETSRRILKAGDKIGIMDGIYVFHYYRLKEGIRYRKHLTDNIELKLI